MRAFVVFRLPSTEPIELEHGAMIGRVRTAALVLDDPRISEAHALVSLRGERERAWVGVVGFLHGGSSVGGPPPEAAPGVLRGRGGAPPSARCGRADRARVVGGDGAFGSGSCAPAPALRSPCPGVSREGLLRSS